MLEHFDPNQPDTFEPVVRAYQSSLVTFAWRMLGNGADAEEAVQESFIRAFRHLRRRPRETWGDIELTPWLYRIALNVCRTKGKAQSRRVETTDRAPLDEAPSHECWDAPALQETIESAIGRLPSPYRAVVLMRYIDQLSYQEIAHALNQPLGTVKAKIHRGTRKLRRLLADSLEAGDETAM